MTWAEFERYHVAHPQIYAAFRSYAKMVRRQGFKQFGAKAIMERVRWEMAFGTPRPADGSPFDFKITNDMTSYYVRKLARDEPEFLGFFEMRRLQSDEPDDIFESNIAARRRKGRRRYGDELQPVKHQPPPSLFG